MTKPRPTQRKLASIAIPALLALLMLPNLIWLSYAHDPSNWVQALILPAVLLLALFTLLGRAPWLACLVLAPFALLAPLEAFYVAAYHTPSSAQVLATLAATTPQETRQYIGPMLPLAIAAPLFGCVLALAGAWFSLRSRLRWQGRLRGWALAVVIATPVVALALGFARSQGTPAQRWSAAAAPIHNLVRSIKPGFPFGIFQRIDSYRQQWDAMRANARQFSNFSFHAQRTTGHTADHKRQVYVLVIGESSARGHWQLFGYDRPTNPELSKVKNLVPIPRMLTSWPETITAVPVLLTRKPITSGTANWKEPSFLPAMQEAGFHTWWISNQYPVGKFDSPVAMYAYEAQHVLWLNHTANWDNPGSQDGVLLGALRRALQHSHHDLFIVLHMMGSHMHYDYRYPASFARFQPNESDKSSKVPRYKRIRNSYDNTIVYTDHILARIIHILNNSDAVTALWYESDHGEVLPTPQCDERGHGHGTWHEYEIPALFWYSDAYAKNFPKKVRMLRSNAGKRTLSADTFASMLDMAGVNFPGLDHSWSLFSHKWKYRRRIVSQIWSTDFDHAMFGKKCGLVMPPASSQKQKE